MDLNYKFDVERKEKDRLREKIKNSFSSGTGLKRTALLAGDFSSGVETGTLLIREGPDYLSKRKLDRTIMDCYEIDEDVWLENIAASHVPTPLWRPNKDAPTIGRIHATGIVTYIRAEILDYIIKHKLVYDEIWLDFLGYLSDVRIAKIKFLLENGQIKRVWLTMGQCRDQGKSRLELINHFQSVVNGKRVYDRESWVRSHFEPYGRVEFESYKDTRNPMALILIDGK